MAAFFAPVFLEVDFLAPARLAVFLAPPGLLAGLPLVPTAAQVLTWTSLAMAASIVLQVIVGA